MKTKILLIILGAVLIVAGVGIVLFATGVFAPAAEWSTNLEAATNDALDAKKNVLLVFAGTEWDGVSATFKESVLDTERFRKTMGRKYELVFIDIPADEDPFADADNPPDWYTLATQYALQATPTLMLINGQGEAYGNIMYEETFTEPQTVIGAIKTVEDNIKKVAQLSVKIEKANGIKKVKLIDELFEATAPNERDSLIAYIRQVPELDPNNESGVLGKYKLQLAYLDASSVMNTGEVEKARDMFLSLTEGDLLEADYKQEALFMAAYISYMTGIADANAVADLLQQAIDASPESESVESIKYTLDQIKLMEQTPIEGTEASEQQ